MKRFYNVIETDEIIYEIEKLKAEIKYLKDKEKIEKLSKEEYWLLTVKKLELRNLQNL